MPEPMVFDLVRPLGVRRGELEVNTLVFVPLRLTRSSRADQRARKRPFEWSPEIEYGLFDNVAIEFELPMADGRVEALKGAVQYTIGTAFNDQFVQGVQGILLIDRTDGAVTPTILYVAAVRFDPVYSMNVFMGFSREIGGDSPINQNQIIVAPTLFAQMSQRWTLGLEANYLVELRGRDSLLFMPQAHWTPTENVSLQFGIGTRARKGAVTGEAIFRVVRQF